MNKKNEKGDLLILTDLIFMATTFKLDVFKFYNFFILLENRE